MPTHLKKLLQGQLPPTELEYLTGSYDIVGDIALIRLAPSLQHRAAIIGKTILQTNNRLKTVACRNSKHKGEFRTTELEIIAGEKRTQTMVQEFGLRYELDLASCYFSVRSGAERRRIASLVQQGERVMVLFSGVAPLPLMIAKYSSAKQVIGVEKNSIAHDFAIKNCKRNRVAERVQLHCADAADLPEEIIAGKKFHRLVMPLPVGGERFLASAIPLLRCGGVLHFYKMSTQKEKEKELQHLHTTIKTCNRDIRLSSIITAGHCGNKLFRYVFEVKTI